MLPVPRPWFECGLFTISPLQEVSTIVDETDETDGETGETSVLTSSVSKEDASLEMQSQALDGDSQDDDDSTLTMLDCANLYLLASRADMAKFTPPPGHEK